MREKGGEERKVDRIGKEEGGEEREGEGGRKRETDCSCLCAWESLYLAHYFGN